MQETKLPKSLFPRLRRGIKTRNYASLPFPLSYQELSVAADRFLDFCELPDPVKNKFELFINPRDKESLVGYVKRQKVRISGSKERQFYDKKEYFHYNRYAEDGFEELLQGADPRVKKFFISARKIYREAERLVRVLAKEFDEEFPGTYQQFFPEKEHPHFYLRFLKYNPEGKGKFLAKGHYDQGTMTLALAESAPGLRIGKNQKTLKEIKHKDGQAVFMPGLQLYRITSEDFRPAWHDVVQKKDDGYAADTARWAVVFFADTINKAKTQWKDRHEPLTF